MSRPILMLALVHALGAAPLVGQTSAQPDLASTTPIEYARVVLERVEDLAIGARIDADGERHVGPTPQDFYAAFTLGSEAEIPVADANAVALIAIQALAHYVHALEEENAKLRGETAGLWNELANLRVQFERFEGERR
jgi:hypothetical protein